MKQPPANPTQTEVDLLAVFIETAEELRREPFFDLHELSSVTSRGDKLVEVEMGDRFHFRSALIPFRRLWREGEDTHYNTILSLIERHDRSSSCTVASLRDAHRKLEASSRNWPAHVNIATKELVDGWLYSVFIHTNVGKRRRNNASSFDRLTFAEWVKNFGHASLEYAFREAVRSAGFIYFQILDCLAKPLSHKWAHSGHTPQFTSTPAFGSAKRERMQDGTVVIRKSSSLYGVDETLLQRFDRLLRRFSALRGLLSDLRMKEEELLKATVTSRTIREIIAEAGMELHVSEYYQPSPAQREATRQFIDEKTLKMCNVILRGEGLIIADRNAIRVWSRDYARFKELLASKS